MVRCKAQTPNTSFHHGTLVVGISAFGTRLSFYKYDKETRALRPEFIQSHSSMLTDVAPIDHWDCDVLQKEGGGSFESCCRGDQGDVQPSLMVRFIRRYHNVLLSWCGCQVNGSGN